MDYQLKTRYIVCHMCSAQKTHYIADIVDSLMAACCSNIKKLLSYVQNKKHNEVATMLTLFCNIINTIIIIMIIISHLFYYI